MPDNRPLAQLHIDQTARDYIARCGGELYIWSDSVGLAHSSVGEPRREERWLVHDVGGLAVHIGDSAADATHWYVRLMRFPWKRLDVTSNLGGRGQTQIGTTVI